ncbi:MAG TPA: hypothetical protein VFA60_04885 [Terriglobales bacterium]|nr:hypothetical protein [Terriglobales bacterium]
MPDFHAMVVERLRLESLPVDQSNEIVSEIASHLEDRYNELTNAGEPDPLERTLAEIPNWALLRREITQNKGGFMNVRYQFFVPGIFAMVAAKAAQSMVFSLIAANTTFGHDRARLFGIAWVLTFALGGAVGGALARRYGLSARARLLASLTPAAYLPAVIDLAGIASVLTIPQVHDSGLLQWLVAFSGALAACLIGGLPFLAGPQGTRSIGAGGTAQA